MADLKQHYDETWEMLHKANAEIDELRDQLTTAERERDEAQQTVKYLLYSAEKSGDLMLAVMRERDEALKDSARLNKSERNMQPDCLSEEPGSTLLMLHIKPGQSIREAIDEAEDLAATRGEG